MSQAQRSRAAYQRLLRQVEIVSPREGPLEDFWAAYDAVLELHRRFGPRLVSGRGIKQLIPDVISTEQALDLALARCLEGHPELAALLSEWNERETGVPKWFAYMFIREAVEKLTGLLHGQPVAGLSVVDGTIRARDYFAETVDGIELARLGECGNENCRRIFFRKQERSKYCSEQCRRNVANRLLRYLEGQGFDTDNLTPKDKLKKAALTLEWKRLHGVPLDEET